MSTVVVLINVRCYKFLQQITLPLSCRTTFFNWFLKWAMLTRVALIVDAPNFMDKIFKMAFIWMDTGREFTDFGGRRGQDGGPILLVIRPPVVVRSECNERAVQLSSSSSSLLRFSPTSSSTNFFYTYCPHLYILSFLSTVLITVIAVYRCWYCI